MLFVASNQSLGQKRGNSPGVWQLFKLDITILEPLFPFSLLFFCHFGVIINKVIRLGLVYFHIIELPWP